NANIVPRWATLECFNELDRKGLMMYGQMTAGSWIYIGTQGIVQGTYETFAEMGRQHYGGDLRGRWILTAGLGGMGGAQPLAAVMAGAHCIAIEVQESRIEKRQETRERDPAAVTEAAKQSMARHVEAMLAYKAMGVPTFDYGNNIRQEAFDEGVTHAFDFPGFVPAYVRPLFCRGIGPFRWVALS